MTAEGDARRARLGPAAVAEARRIGAAAPPWTAEQKAALAVLLRPVRRPAERAA